MKATSRFFQHFVATIISAASAIAATTDLVWDTSAATGVQGGSGSWTTSLTNWTDDGGATRVSWDGAGRSAVFSSGTGVVTVSGEIDISSLAVTSSASSTIGGRTVGYLFNGGIFRFGSERGKIDCELGQTTLQVNSQLTGTGGLQVRSGGADTGSAPWLVLHGDNRELTGGIHMESGLLGIARPEAVGTNVIRLQGQSGIFAPVTHSGIGTGGAVSPTGQLSLQNEIQLEGSNRFRIWGNRTVELNGIITGRGSLRKTGDGTLILSGSAGHKGDTSVEAGILSLGNATLADHSAVHLLTGGEINLAHGEADVVGALTIDGVPKPRGVYHKDNTPQITGPGNLVVTGSLLYDDWLTHHGFVPGSPGTTPGECLDGSGVENALQFFLGGNPRSASDNGVHSAFTKDAAGKDNFLLTIAVPAGVLFSGGPNATASVDGMPFSIQGSTDLDAWTQPVEEVPVQDGGNPNVPAGYSLRSFRLVQEPALNSKGFLRVKPWQAPAKRPNVLLIAVDDLRPWLGVYNPALTVSPNIDRLAASGRTFTRCYANSPTCGASRNSLLYGRRPGRTASDTNNDAVRLTSTNPPHPALPSLFRNHGYRTVAVGKISHYPGGLTGSGWATGPEELPGAWDVSTMPVGPWTTPERAMHGYANGVARQDSGSNALLRPVTQFQTGDDMTYPDGWTAA
ncbi:MAG: hypothetical protein EOP85_02325, partial [Verrucomicrobiaceae bacterium]